MGYLLRGTSPHLPGRTKCRDRANRSRSVHSSRRPRIFSPRLSPIFLFLVTDQTALFLSLSLLSLNLLFFPRFSSFFPSFLWLAETTGFELRCFDRVFNRYERRGLKVTSSRTGNRPSPIDLLALHCDYNHC